MCRDVRQRVDAVERVARVAEQLLVLLEPLVRGAQAISISPPSWRVIASSGSRSSRTSSSGNTCTGKAPSAARRAASSGGCPPPSRRLAGRGSSARSRPGGPAPYDAARRPRPSRGTSISRLRILPVGPFGQLVDEPDPARVLVGGHLLLDVALQLVGVERLALLQHDRGAHLLAELVVRHADDGRLLDRRVLVEHLLDLARVDVVAAADDQVLLAVDDEEVAVLVHLGHVAGAEPAVVGDRLLGGLRRGSSSPS